MNKIYKYTGKPFIKINELQKQIIQKFVNLKDKKFFFENNPCLCNLDDSITISERCKFGLKIKFKLCKSCGIIRQDPIMNEESTKEFYKNFYRKLYTGEDSNENKESIFFSQYKSGKKYYSLIADQLSKHNYSMRKIKNVLEIGSSCCGILKFFSDQNHNVYGLDYDEEYLNFGKTKGINQIYSDISKINQKFDLIILSHTFEHFKDLKKNIQLIESLLNKNGFIFLDLPGIFNYDYYHLRNLIYNYKKIHFLFYLQNAHNYYFVKETFSRFINNNSRLQIIYIDEKINCILKKVIKFLIIRMKKMFIKNFKFYKIQSP